MATVVGEKHLAGGGPAAGAEDSKPVGPEPVAEPPTVLCTFLPQLNTYFMLWLRPEKSLLNPKVP